MMDGSEDNQALASSDDEVDDPFSGIPASNSTATHHSDIPVELEDNSDIESFEEDPLSENDYETGDPTSPGH